LPASIVLGYNWLRKSEDGHMKKKAGRIVVILWILCISAGAGALCDDAVIEFDPPDGTVFFLTVTTTTTRQADEHTPVIDVVEKHWKITYQKEDGRIRQAWEPLSVRTARDGREFIHPVHTALMAFPFTLTLGPGAEVLSIEGLAGVQARLKGQVPDTAWHSLAPLISEQMLTAGEKADWELLAGECAGRRAAAGEAWHGVATLGLAKRPGRPYFRLARVKQPIHYAGRPLLKVEEFRNTDAEALKKAAGIDALLFSAADMEAVSTWKGEEGVRKIIAGEGFRILDPRNLLLYYAYLNLKERTIFEAPGGGKSVLKLNEEREFRFSYPSQKIK
jgi:hypothetical protein